jgi:PKHD-type hydroxylase
MITCVPELLTPDECQRVCDGLAAADFADGRQTAGWHAREVKNNRQLTSTMPGHAPLDGVVRGALLRNPVFRLAVRPKFLRPILFNRHDVGMSYGPHVDDAIMGTADKGEIRTDVSFTLFLSEQDAYEGGELVFDLAGIQQEYKLPRGSLVAYPSSTLHQVAPVTAGVRLAAVGWAQSLVRDEARRNILFDLDRAQQRLFDREGKSDVFDLLAKTHANLFRMWVDS